MKPQLYIYGVRKRKKGGLKAFATLKEGGLLPTRIIERKEGLLTLHQAKSLAGTMRKEVRERAAKLREEKLEEKRLEKQRLESLPIAVGSIATHNDREGVHFAAVIDIVGDEAYALFLTSNPHWCEDKPRLATETECGLFGLVKKGDTYIVPVVRPVDEFFAVRGELSSDRLQQYRTEFSGAFSR